MLVPKMCSTVGNEWLQLISLLACTLPWLVTAVQVLFLVVFVGFAIG
jgi:hypothetical protein